MNPKTIVQKIWQSHIVDSLGAGEVLIYIDLHLLHEINTPPAFEGLKEKGIKVHRPDRTLSTEDHNTPTTSVIDMNKDSLTWTQIDLLRRNCELHGIKHNKLGSYEQGITHVIAPEQGRVIPGITLVCCDSHTTTHGAFGALAYGIGTSQVEHVLATQTLRAIPFKTMCIQVDGKLSVNVDAKDLALSIIRKIGTGGGQGYIIEYTGSTISSLSMEQRMTLCNMTVEAGASAGIISPDDTTISYLQKALAKHQIKVSQEMIQEWMSYATDREAKFDKYVQIDAEQIQPMITWGTNPSQVISLGEKIPFIEKIDDPSECLAARQAIEYMGLHEGETVSMLPITNVFIGSCTNGRIEDLRVVASLLKYHEVHSNVNMLIVPGSMAVYRQAVKEGLDKIFERAGADFRRLSGCSLCVGLNSDKLKSGKRVVSTSNRNFEGRQGIGVRTHITSPRIATLSAIKGHIPTVDDLELLNNE